MLKLAPLVWTGDLNENRPSGATAQTLWLPQLASKAFGDGTHPTTRLCAGATDFLLRSEKSAHVLDVGTGTGILARIARARGALQVVGTDIDPQALGSARENARLDGEGMRPIEWSAHAPDHWRAIFNLVIANILEAPLRDLAPNLRSAMAPGAALILSGFTPLQVPFLRERFESQGLCLKTSAELEGWALLEFRARV